MWISDSDVSLIDTIIFSRCGANRIFIVALMRSKELSW